MSAAGSGARATASPTAKRPIIGILLVLLSAAAVALSPTAAKLALDAGSNTLTVVAARGAIGVVLMGALIAGTGQGVRMGRPALLRCLAAGFFYAVTSYGFLGSVAYIPVSLAVLIFFTHPLLVAALAGAQGGERLTPRKLALALVALAGLALALAPEFVALDPVGVGLAALAAVAACGMILLTARAQEGATSNQVNLVMTGVTAAVFGAITTASGAWSFPSGAVGWLGLVATGVSVTVGLLAFFAAFRHIGPVRATMLSNVEPLLSVLVAVAVLGERLGPWQWGGVALVVAALVLFEVPKRERPPSPGASAR